MGRFPRVVDVGRVSDSGVWHREASDVLVGAPLVSESETVCYCNVPADAHNTLFRARWPRAAFRREEHRRES